MFGVFENISSRHGSLLLSHRFVLYFFSAAAFSRSKQQECVSGKTHAAFARERFDAPKEEGPEGERAASVQFSSQSVQFSPRLVQFSPGLVQFFYENCTVDMPYFSFIL